MILYHQTSTESVASIMVVGLKKSWSKYWQGRGGCIYLSKVRGGKNSIPKCLEETLLEVDVTGLDLSKLSDWEYLCWEDIPPERLKVIKK